MEILLDTWHIEPWGKLVGKTEPEEALPKGHKLLLKEPELLANVGAIVGWAGLFILDESLCPVQLLKKFFEAVQEKSCGRCVPCRVGSRVILDRLNDLSQARAQEGSLEQMLKLAQDAQMSALCGFGLRFYKPLKDALHHFKAHFEAHLKEGKVCPDVDFTWTMTAPCNHACPVTTDAAGYLEKITEGKFIEGVDIAREPNPLVGMVGRVCVHPCETACMRGHLDEPLAICHLKRAVADYERTLLEEDLYKRSQQKPSEPKKGQVAVIGAGPAGLTCAKDLALLGYKVTIFEKYPVVGGTTHLGIPEYRLPRDVIDEDVEQIRTMGVEIKTSTPMGEGLSLEDLFMQGHGAVFLSVGALKGRKLEIPGEEDYQGFYDCVEYLRRVNLGDKSKLGDKVVIVGGGNSAIDAARVSLRLGCKEVTILYRRTRKEMPANPWEVDEAEHEGVKIHYLAAPVKIVGSPESKVKGMECIMMELGEPDASGRRRPVPVKGSEFIVEADLIVPAISQEPDLKFLGEDHNLKVTKWSTLEIEEESLATSRPGVFAGGDVVTGPDTVIGAIRAGHVAAAHIDQYLSGNPHGEFKSERRMKKIIDALGISLPDELKPDIPGRARQTMPALPVEKRLKSFEEAETGYSHKQAISEAKRCLRCYRIVGVAKRRVES